MEISVPLIEEVEGDAAADKEQLRKQLCPYAAVGECRYGINCAYLHGDVCDMCGLQVLHPTDNSQRSQHTKVTMARFHLGVGGGEWEGDVALEEAPPSGGGGSLLFLDWFGQQSWCPSGEPVDVRSPSASALMPGSWAPFIQLPGVFCAAAEF